MDEHEWLAKRFEGSRDHLRAVAYRMLGSLGDADDAVQEAWLRLSRADTRQVENLEGWLTTVVARVCLDMLRSRTSRREEPLGEHLPGPAGGQDPEQEAVLADSVGLALLVVLQALTPAERIAFVLHDMFNLPFDQVAAAVGRSPAAARQLASRARRRVRGTDRVPHADLARKRQVAEAFLAASRGGDFDALFALLDPDVVLHADLAALPPGMPATARGAANVAARARSFSGRAAFTRVALVDGSPGLILAPGGRLALVLSFGIRDHKIVEMDVIADPERLRQLHLAVLED